MLVRYLNEITKLSLTQSTFFSLQSRTFVSASSNPTYFWRKKAEPNVATPDASSSSQAPAVETIDDAHNQQDDDDDPVESFQPEIVGLDDESATTFPKPESAPEQFAVVVMGSKQYKVSPGDRIMVDRIQGPDIGERISLKKVLLAGSKEYTAIGRPLLGSCRVFAEVEEHIRTEKVIVFKKKRRKNYRRRRGVRTAATVMRITDLQFSPDAEFAPSLLATHEYAPVDARLIEYNEAENARVAAARSRGKQIRDERKVKKRGYVFNP